MNLEFLCVLCVSVVNEASAMDLTTFLTERRPEWRKLEHLLEQVEGSGLASLDEEQAIEFGQLYRRAASDLNQAQTFVTGDATVRYLNDLVARAYVAIYGKTRIDLWGIVVFFLWGYPAVFRRYLPHFLLASALFAVGGAVGYLAATYDKSVARSYLLPDSMPTIQPPKEGDDEAQPAMTSGQLSAFSSYLYTHNVSVTLVACALGVTFGIGSAWLMFVNGLGMGALASVFVEAGQFKAFATGILPHGVLEIPAAVLGGAAGFVLAEAMIRAKPWPRPEELRRVGKEALLLVSGCIMLLAFAGILEAGVARAPDWVIDSGMKLTVAGVFGLLFLVYTLLFGWSWRRKNDEARQ
jgi:uncharacterized membrane protein SpoIIM required for sporulation